MDSFDHLNPLYDSDPTPDEPEIAPEKAEITPADPLSRAVRATADAAIEQYRHVATSDYEADLAFLVTKRLKIIHDKLLNDALKSASKGKITVQHLIDARLERLKIRINTPVRAVNPTHVEEGFDHE
jgi:hypothetical protein